ncbi:MAG: CBS domain-containing protein [Burkholderiales bacterium]|nr:CBS domain-containing protein [Burkholderiales bacterium]
MRPILELLKTRDGATFSLNPQDSVFSALQQLADHDVGAMMVLDQGKLVGVFSERDYTRKIALAGKSSKDTKVADIMTAGVITVGSQVDSRDCMALMAQKKIRHLPVVDDGKVVGMISIRDIMNDIISDHEMTISHLEHYISS